MKFTNIYIILNIQTFIQIQNIYRITQAKYLYAIRTLIKSTKMQYLLKCNFYSDHIKQV